MSEQTAVNTEVYVTSDPQEAVALSARLTVAGIENRIEPCGIGGKVVYVEFPMDMGRARAERERYFRDMGWA
jgi:hypothetical protein